MSSTTIPPLPVDASSHGARTEASDAPLTPHVSSQLEAAYREQASRLLSYLRRRAGDDAASDLVQEVFARTAASRKLSNLMHPGAYLFKVARNLLIERNRSQQRQAVVLMTFDDERDAACRAEQAEAIEARDLMQRYERAVSTMSEKTRTVFLMHRVDEIPHREIAESLGISVATVEYHMTKALAHLAKRLDFTR